MGKKNRGLFSILAVLFLTLFLAFPVIALETKSGDTVYIQSGQIKGPLFVTGNMVTVNADVEGDVFAAGQSISINGTVSGDIIAAGNTINISGSVLGDIRTAGNTIDILGPVEGSVTAAGNTISLKQSSAVKKDVLLMGNVVEISCPVGSQVMGSANQMNLNSSVQGDVNIWDVQQLYLGPNALINGSITYRSANQAQIAPGALTGEIQQLLPLPVPEKIVPEKGFSWLAAVIQFAAGILFWAIIYLLIPKFLPSMEKTALRSPLPSLGWGFLALILTPIAALLLMVTVIGIPLALILLLVYIVILGTAKIIIGDVLGRFIANIFKQEGRWPFVIAFIVAYAILIFLGKIPIFGFFFNLIIAFMALGVFILTYYRWRKEQPSAPGQAEPMPESLPEPVE